MCGRFTLTASGEEVAELFGLDAAPALSPRYNIAPSQPVSVVRLEPDGGRRLSDLTWGLRAPGAREGDRPFINARAETAGERVAFREAFAERRCLVVASGFFEWEGTPRGRRRGHAGKKRQPWYFRRADGRPFAIAGLWEPSVPPEGRATCTLLTTRPNALVAPIHDRMPVILDAADAAAWLDPALRTPAELQPLLRAFPAPALTAYRVGFAANNAKFDDPTCIAPLA
jgi:putative SOS response-associated peptidase YedK